MSEDVGQYFHLAGAVLFFLGWIWLIVSGFLVGTAWGIALLFGIPALVFVPIHWRRALPPVLLSLLGVTVFAFPLAMNIINREATIDLGEREYEDSKGILINLTKWNKTDYSFLPQKKDTATLLMANPDVTDETVQLLKGFDKLKKLDLSNTSISDDSLSVLMELPQLTELNLRKTKITDAGFENFVRNMPALQKLNLQGTEVTRELALQWKNEDKARRLIGP